MKSHDVDGERRISPVCLTGKSARQRVKFRMRARCFLFSESLPGGQFPLGLGLVASFSLPHHAPLREAFQDPPTRRACPSLQHSQTPHSLPSILCSLNHLVNLCISLSADCLCSLNCQLPSAHNSTWHTEGIHPLNIYCVKINRETSLTWGQEASRGSSGTPPLLINCTPKGKRQIL